MSRLRWMFSAILLVSFIMEAVSDTTAQQIIDIICKQTEDYKLCNTIFAENLKTSSPSIKDLTNITVEEADRFSANTMFFISQLLRNAGNERSGLQRCADAYAEVNVAFSLAFSSLSQGQYSSIHNLEEGVSTAVGICKPDFNVPSFDVNPLVERNRKMRILMTMARIVSNMLNH